MAGPYEPVAQSDSPASPVGRTLSGNQHRDSIESTGSGSDIVYRDVLDQDPFEEKIPLRRQEQASGSSVDEDGIGFPMDQRRSLPRKQSRKILIILIVIMAAAGGIGLLAATGYNVPSYAHKSGNRHIALDHTLNGTFSVQRHRIAWVKEAEDGTYSENDGSGNIILATVSDPNNTQILVKRQDVIDPRTGEGIAWSSWQLSADMEYVLFQSDHRKQWRHSSHANYWVHRLKDKRTFAIQPPRKRPTISYATWSPVSHSLAFVDRNDLYVLPALAMEDDVPKPTRVTYDGSAVVFNGVPDWVYEEEVFATDSALWWSPDGETVAYLRSNETEVKEYRMTVYNPTSNPFAVNPYVSEVDMRYPKPGTPNPLVTLHVFSLAEFWGKGSHGKATTTTVQSATHDLSWPGEYPLDNRVLVEVAWVASDGLMVKEIDRAARRGQVVVFENGNPQGRVVRKLGKEGEEGDDGWIDHGQNVVPIREGAGGYLDVVPTPEGWNHVAYFSPVNATEPIWVTSGDWEVTSINGVDQKSGIVYFTAANPSIDRHLYSVAIPQVVNKATLVSYKPELKALTDVDQPGYFSASFSPGAGYYSLQYEGPYVPWQRIIQTGEGGIDRIIEDNNHLNKTISEFHRPLETRRTLVSGDYEFNVLEIHPPNIDTSGRKKYPVLINVYGGPYSQQVDNTFKRDWHTYLASELKYIVVKIDGRGTGFKGRRLRNPIRDNLGHYEVEDQIALARDMIKRKYVDRSRVGIWGWSYGGYMTLKTLEAGSGLFTLGMAVAPVTDWRYYDSIYTERYMNTPAANTEGYVRSAINNVTNFNGIDLILAHGTGDDNVHFQNMASLTDKLTAKKVRGWQMRVFTDSAHSINTRGAYGELIHWLVENLSSKWGKGGNIQG